MPVRWVGRRPVVTAFGPGPEQAPAETFLDTVTRRRFDNVAGYEALYGDAVPVIAELDAPRVKSARQLPQALRAGLAAGLVPAA